MGWMQPQLTDPPMGPTDEIRKLQHRLIFAYNGSSKAIELGVTESGIFDSVTDEALRNVQSHIGGAINSQPGVLTYDTKVRLGVFVPQPKAPTKRFHQQGVGFDTSAFLMGTPDHSYNDAMVEAPAEFLRLALPDTRPKVLYGYSMGADAVVHALKLWPVERRDEIKVVCNFGNPARPPGPTLFGDDPGGSGIAGAFTPEWVRDRAYDFAMPGDMYPNAGGLLPQLYQILVRLEASTDFALYLFQLFATTAGQMLLGLIPGAELVAGSLSGLLGLITPGPKDDTSEPINLLAMIVNIPAIIVTIVKALKFVVTNAHYHYHDQPMPQWRNLTAVDCAAAITAEKVRDAVVYTFPGTVSFWNDGPPAWAAWKLP